MKRDSKTTRVEKRGLIYLRDYSGLEEVVIRGAAEMCLDLRYILKVKQ